jgi:hypothetical protein
MADWSPNALPNEDLSMLPVRRKRQDALWMAPAPGPRSSIGVWTPICIVGGTLFAAITALVHYLFVSRLENHSVLGYWTQNRSSQVEIALATVFRILYCFSAGVSLCQVVRDSLVKF